MPQWEVGGQESEEVGKSGNRDRKETVEEKNFNPCVLQNKNQERFDLWGL